MSHRLDRFCVVVICLVSASPTTTLLGEPQIGWFLYYTCHVLKADNNCIARSASDWTVFILSMSLAHFVLVNILLVV